MTCSKNIDGDDDDDDDSDSDDSDSDGCSNYVKGWYWIDDDDGTGRLNDGVVVILSYS